jgi:hypothetical protein
MNTAFLSEDFEQKNTRGRYRHRWKRLSKIENIKIKKMKKVWAWTGLNWLLIGPSDAPRYWNFGCYKERDSADLLSDCQRLKRDCMLRC